MRTFRLSAVVVLMTAIAIGQSDKLPGVAKAQARNCHEHRFGTFSDWSGPVNLGPVVNAAANEQWPAIAPNDLSLYFSTNRAGGSGLQDIWVTQRPTTTSPWGTPQNLGHNVNSSARDNTPYVSPNGHWLFFSSNRPGGCGGSDLYVSFRAKTDDDFAWQPAVNLGCQVNDIGDEIAPNLVVNDDTGTTMLYFMSDRLGMLNIFVSTLQSDGNFGTPTIVEELKSNVQGPPGGDGPVWIRNDGLEMLMNWSTVRGVFIDSDVWVSTRRSLWDPWSTPQKLGAPLNSSFAEGSPSLSCDGTSLYFASNRAGGSGGTDIWVSTRTPVDGEGKK